MPLVNLATDVICDALIGGTTYNRFNSTNSYLGVGDSTTAYSAAHTDLQAATNKLRNVVDSAPTRSGSVLTFVSTFGTSQANWAWNEWAIFNHATLTAAPGAMLSRKQEALGTKASGTWVLTVTLTITL